MKVLILAGIAAVVILWPCIRISGEHFCGEGIPK